MPTFAKSKSKQLVSTHLTDIVSPGKLSSSPNRIAAIYIVLGLLWIWFSDRTLLWMGIDGENGFWIATFKGTMFVVLSGFLVRWLVRQEFRALARSNNLLRAVTEGTLEAVYVKDLQGHYLLCNESAANYLGRSVEEVLGGSDSNLFSTQDVIGIREQDRRVITQGVSESTEINLAIAGVNRTYLSTKAPYRDDEGSVIGLVGISLDITDRKLAENAIRESEERFRATFEQAAVGIAHIGLDGRFIMMNRRLAEITGYPPDELSKKSFQQITHPEDLATDLAQVEKLLAGQVESYALEKRYIRKDGSIVWIDLTVSMRRSSDGKPLHFISVIEDITVRKQAEKESREAKELLRLVLDTVPNGVFWKDLNSRYIGCNSQMAHILGFASADQVIGLSDAEIPSVGVEKASDFVIKDREVIQTGEPCLKTTESLTSSKGETIWLETNQLALRDGSGEVIGVLGTWENVTSRRRTELALCESEENLRLALRVAGLGVTRIDYRRDICVLSIRAGELMGLPAEVPISRSAVHDRIHPEDRPEIDRLIALSLESNGPGSFETEYRVVRPDGKVRWLSVRKQISFESGLPSIGIWVAADVTERREAEEAVREQADFVRAVLDGMNSHIAVLDRNGVIIAVNGAWEEFSRQNSPDGKTTRNTMIGVNYLAICDVEASKKNKEENSVGSLIRKVMQGELEHVSFNYPCHSPTEQRWYLMDVTPVKRGRGEVVVSHTNVTERRRIEEDLRESEERFRAVAEGLADPLYVHDEFGRILYANPRSVTSLGYSLDEILSRRIIDIDAGFSRENLLNLWNRQLSKPFDQATIDTVHRRKDGSKFPVEIRLSLIRWRGRTAFLTSAHDLSERKRVELQLRHQEMLLREAAQLAHVGGWAFDPSNRNLDWTPELFRIHEIDSPIPVTVEDAINYFHGEDRERIVNAVMDAITLGKPYDLELQIVTAKGNRKWVRTTCQPMIENGIVLSVRGSMQEITARKQLEEQFRQAQKMEAVGRLAGGIAHDFNNMLTVINGYSELLLDQLPTNDESRSIVKEIYDSGERASGLTSQLLAFSRKAVISPRVLNLNEVVAHSEKLLRRLIREDIILTVLIPSTPCRVEADPNQLDQVLINLAVNSRDAMPGSGRLTIKTEVCDVATPLPTSDGELKPGKYVHLSVRDTGVGMSKEVLSNIFEPFFTTKGVGKGTGLGLAVVHGVVRQAGGEIIVESELEQGTTFHLYFPESPPQAQSEESVDSVSASRGTETILLAEDEEAVRVLFRIALESQGYKVVAVGGGHEAIEAIAKLSDPPHILVTDMVMPEMNGRELAEAIRARIPEIPVLFVSGYTDDQILRHGIIESNDTFLLKPFSPLGLARKVRVVLDGQNLKQNQFGRTSEEIATI